MKDYVPSSPIRKTIFFHRDFLNRAYERVRDGTPTLQIWNAILRKYPEKFFEKMAPYYQQFLNVLQVFCCWEVQEQELDFHEFQTSKTGSWAFKCPCCFGDPNTTKNIIILNLFLNIHFV